MDKGQIVSEIKNFILRGNTQKALEILLNNTFGIQNKEAIILFNRLIEIKRKLRMGFVSIQEEQIEVNKINNSILSILDHLNDDEHSKYSDYKAKESKLTQSNLAQIILAFFAVVTLLITGISYLGGFSYETKKQPIEYPVKVPVEKKTVEESINDKEKNETESQIISLVNLELLKIEVSALNWETSISKHVKIKRLIDQLESFSSLSKEEKEFFDKSIKAKLIKKLKKVIKENNTKMETNYKKYFNSIENEINVELIVSITNLLSRVCSYLNDCSNEEIVAIKRTLKIYIK